jgi:hypothetical protein
MEVGALVSDRFDLIISEVPDSRTGLESQALCFNLFRFTNSWVDLLQERYVKGWS